LRVCAPRIALFSSITLRPELKADSDATVDAGTTKQSLAILDNKGYWGARVHHQVKMLKLSSGSWISYFKYASRSVVALDALEEELDEGDLNSIFFHSAVNLLFFVDVDVDSDVPDSRE